MRYTGRGGTIRVGTGGPYSHKLVDGICRVCGYGGDGSLGCPWQVNMDTLKTGKPLSSAHEVEQAHAALQAIWAAEKAAKEEVG
jgi:hypothetical protein